MMPPARRLCRLAVIGLPTTALLCSAMLAKAQETAVEPGPDAVGAAREAGASLLSNAQIQQNLESFDLIWETILVKHFDPDLNGVDWAGVRDELRPKVAQAASMAEARDAMREMLGRLGQSHFGIIPGSVYDEIDDEGLPSGEGSTGLHVRVIDGEALVVMVEPGSSAEEAGVSPGWVVSGVEGKPIEPVLEKVAGAYGDSTQLALHASRAVERRLDGPVGSHRTITFLDGDGECATLTLELKTPRGKLARFGNLPAFRVHFESRLIEGDISYVHWTAFFDPVTLIPRIGEAITSRSDARGLVVDLRGNPGGIGAMAMGICGWLIDEAGQKLGTMSTRDTTLNFVVFPRPETYQGPVAVLVDGCSASTPEILAGGLQDLGRARIFGTRTAGAALPSVVTKLPNGDRFQYAFANYVSADGDALEGVGVIPDHEVPPTREALLLGRDPALDAAIEWLRDQPTSGGDTD